MNARPFAFLGLVVLALPSFANGQRSEARAQARAQASRNRSDLRDSQQAFRDAQQAARELKLAMERGRFVSAMAIIRKYTGDKDNSTVELQLMQSAAGMSKTTIMAPLCMQGEVSVDDGKNWFYLLKDKKEILVGPSPRLSGEDPNAKLRSALQNYELSFGDPTKVAGRKALQIVATPKCPDMPTRKFFIDSDNHFILRVQEENKRRCKTLMDTKMVRFGMNFSDQEFSMDGQSGKIRSFSAPTHFQHSMWVKDKVGFKPAIPKELPSGFHVLDQQLAGNGTNGVAVRVGDGFASATVYEWDTKSGRQPWGQLPSDAKIVQCKGIKMGLVGDIPEEAIARLLDAFLREAMKKLQPIFLFDSSFGLQEPKAGSQTLNDQKGEFNGQQDDPSQSPAI